LKDHFVASFQKVGAFRIVNGQKQGGNVASYFTTPDGAVLHVVAGPVDAKVLLREARWAVETHKLALTESGGDLMRQRLTFRRAHFDRLQREHGGEWRMPRATPNVAVEVFAMHELRKYKIDQQGQIHLLLTAYPLAKTELIYRTVFETILRERVSTNPVDGRDS